jgi:hypothetical protein
MWQHFFIQRTWEKIRSTSMFYPYRSWTMDVKMVIFQCLRVVWQLQTRFSSNKTQVNSGITKSRHIHIFCLHA